MPLISQRSKAKTSKHIYDLHKKLGQKIYRRFVEVGVQWKKHLPSQSFSAG